MPLNGNADNLRFILLIADEQHGVRLKSDLEFLGNQVQHQVLSESGHLAGAGDLPTNPESVIVEAASQNLHRIITAVRREISSEKVPLIVLADEKDALELDFSLGISDFVVKPYSLREIEARMRLALWNQDRPADSNTIKVQSLVINTARYEVRVGGNPITMTLKEYELLKHLVTHSGRVFTRAELLDSIWGYDYYGGMRTVDVHIRRLRSKLGIMGACISTLRGVGYRFDPSE
jgi:DNA-binding response OmpR family regulator